MLTNTASDQPTARSMRPGDGQPGISHRGLIAGVAGEGDARPKGHLKCTTFWIWSLTWDTSMSRYSADAIPNPASDIRQYVSDQPASLREPYTAISAAITEADRLIADGDAAGVVAVSMGLRWGSRPLDTWVAVPSTQRPTWSRTLQTRRCVLGRIAREAGIRHQRGQGWGGVRGGVCRGHRSALRAERPKPTDPHPDATRANTPPVPVAPNIADRLDIDEGLLPGYPNAALRSSCERWSR